MFSVILVAVGGLACNKSSAVQTDLIHVFVYYCLDKYSVSTVMPICKDASVQVDQRVLFCFCQEIKH